MRDAVSADDLLERRAGRFEQPRFGRRAARLIINLADEVSQHFSVRLRAEFVSRFDESGAKHLIILDDAVVDEGQLSGLVKMRMRVFVGGPAMGGPPRVADARLSRRGDLLDQIGEVLDAAGALAGFELSRLRGEAGGS